MFERTKNGFFAAPNMILVGIGLGLLFWLIDPCIDYFLLGRGSLPHDIFSPSSDEIWFRSFVSFIFIVFGFYVESISTRQRKAEKRLAQTVAIQKAAFESAADGLLVVDENRNVAEYNQKFLNLWGLTPEEMKGADHNDVIKKMLSLLKNPNAQKERIKTLYDNKLTDTYDILELTDGRIFEQYSIAQKIDNEIIGRVWSYRDITQKKLGEEALRQNEKRFRAIADYTYDWENWVGPDNKLIWVNPAVERITGYSIRECMEMPDYPLPLVHKDDRELMRDALSKAAQGVCGNDLPFRIRRKDGGVVWVAVSWQPIYDDHGQNLGHRSTVRDISARKKWEEALAESEKSYRTLAENLPGIVYRQPLGNKAPTQFFNNMVRNLTGYQISELPSAEFCSLESIILEEDREAVKESLSGAVANGFAFMHEYRIRHRDGRIRYFVERGVPVYDSTGKPLHIDGVIFDMTEQKQAQSRIEENEKFLSTIFHGIQDGISVLDKDMNIIRVNSAMEKWYAHQMPLVGKKCFRAFQGRDRACDVCPTARALQTLKPEMDEVPLTGPNGVEGWIELHAFPLIDQSGETIGVVEYVRNITDRKKAEQSLRESEEKFRVLSEQNMLGIMIIQDDILKYVNNPVAQVLGKSPETLTGSPVKEIMPFIHPEDRQFAQEQLAKKQRGETDVVQHYKYRLVLPDRRTMWVEQFSKSIQYGGRWADLVTIVDVTENYRALNALKDSEERYRKLVDSVSDYIYTLNFLDNEPIVGNHGPGCESVTGYSADEFERDPQLWSRIIHDDDRKMIQTYLEKIRRGEETEPLEHRIIHKGGQIRWVKNSVVVRKDPEGKIASYDGLISDITERKEIEEALRENERRLKVKLDFILSPEKNIENINLLDLIDLDELQKIQDAFATACDVASVIIDLNGNSITRPSNFREICRLVGQTEEGARRCRESNIKRGEMSRREMKPVYQKCLSCGFVDASAPIIVAGIHVANWLMGQCNALGVTREEIKQFAAEIGADQERVLEAFDKTAPVPLEQFERTLNLLWYLARELSTLGYGNLLLARDNARLRQIEQSMHESETKLRTILTSAPIAIGLVKDRVFQWINDHMLEMVGYSSEELIGRSSRMLYESEEEFQRVADIKYGQIRKDGTGEIQTRWKRKDGSLIDVYLRSTALEGGDLSAGVIFTAIDITERIRAESSLEESERRFKTLFESAPDAIFLMDAEGRFMDGNTATEHLTGYNRNLLVGRLFNECNLLPDSDLSRAFANLKKNLEGEPSGPDEYKLRRVDGVIIPIEVSTYPVQLSDRHLIIGIARDLSFRVQSELALRESERKLSVLLSNLPGMAYRCLNDPEWTMLFVSEGVGELTGYTHDAFLNNRDMSFSQIIHQDDRVRVWNEIESAIQEKAPYRLTYRIIAADGRCKWVMEQGRGIFDETGKLQFLEGFIIDITDRITAQQSIQAERDRAQKYLDVAGTIIIVLNCDMNIELINKKGCEVLRWKEEDILGKNWFDCCVPPDKREERRQRVRQIFDGAIPFPEYAESIALTQDGQERVIAWHNIPLRDESGNIIRVISSGEDVTERRKAEETLKLTQFSIDHAADAVFWVEPDGRLSYVNTAACNTLGFSHPELLSLSILDIEADLTPDEWARRWSQVQSTRFMSTNSNFRRKDGSLFPVDVTFNYLEYEGRSHLFAFARDITEKRKIEEELFKASKLESIGILAGGIAHDFNNILTAIIGNISLAMLDLADSEELLRRLVDAEKASLRAQELTQQLLTFSRGGAPVKKTIHIEEMIKDSAKFAVHGSRVRCEFLFEPGLFSVEVDEGQLSQVIHNLIINADQAMPQGGVITIKARNIVDSAILPPSLKPGNYVEITVTDTGIGIPPQHLPNIFDPFFTTKQKGSGLGLATTYSIISKHDGVIEVESTVDVGTTFRIYLPASSRPVEDREGQSDMAVRGAGRILIMDDDESIRMVAGIGLSELGYEVSFANDGAQALEMYKSAMGAAPFDVVIMDLTVPGGMGGREAIAQLRQIDPHVVAIVSSGYSNDPVLANYEEFGFKGFVPKPFRIQKLSQVIGEVLSGRSRVRT